MAGFRKPRSMALSDDEQYDWLKARQGGPRIIATPEDEEPPDYPPGLCFTVRERDFEGLAIGEVKPGDTVSFAAFARATSVNQRLDGCRVEAEIDMLSLGDGKMAELDEMCRPAICLDENDHERLDLDETCERGDMLHLIGTVKVTSTDDTEWGGKCLCLQIIEASVEDEDQEAEMAA